MRGEGGRGVKAVRSINLAVFVHIHEIAFVHLYNLGSCTYVQNCFGYCYGLQSVCVCSSIFNFCVCVCAVCPLYVVSIGSEVSVWLVSFCTVMSKVILYLYGLSLPFIPLFV